MEGCQEYPEGCFDYSGDWAHFSLSRGFSQISQKIGLTEHASIPYIIKKLPKYIRGDAGEQ